MMRAFSITFDLLAIVSVLAALAIVAANIAALPTVLDVIASVIHP
jgi:hypothetical protein